MKTLIVTAMLSLLAGCAGMGAPASGGMDTRSDSSADSGYYAEDRDDIFQSWID